MNSPDSIERRCLVCSLFEGRYSEGAGVLVNSLIRAEYSGDIALGYKGDPPNWFHGSIDSHGNGEFKLGTTNLLLKRVQTSRNLTNFKADFMLNCIEESASEYDHIFFFDSDIFVLASWEFFLKWTNERISIVIDGNSPMPQNHPTRIEWKEYAERLGIHLNSTSDYHYNGGFIGVPRKLFNRINDWKRLMDEMEKEVRLDLRIGLIGGPKNQSSRLYKFYLTDQDALNIVASIDEDEISQIGDEAMGWKEPSIFMRHACGSPKPWDDIKLIRCLRGKKPSPLSEQFLEFLSHPLEVWPSKKIKRHRMKLKLARRLEHLSPLFRFLAG